MGTRQKSAFDTTISYFWRPGHRFHNLLGNLDIHVFGDSLRGRRGCSLAVCKRNERRRIRDPRLCAVSHFCHNWDSRRLRLIYRFWSTNFYYLKWFIQSFSPTAVASSAPVTTNHTKIIPTPKPRAKSAEKVFAPPFL